MNNLAKLAIKELKTGLKLFGEYDFFDKGSDSIISFHFIDDFKKSNIDDVIDALKEINKVKKYGPAFVEDILVSLDDWEKWDEMWEKHKTFLAGKY